MEISVGALEFVETYVSRQLIDVLFGVVLLTWILVDIVKRIRRRRRRRRRRGDADADVGANLANVARRRTSMIFPVVTVTCSVIVPLLYFCFGFHEYWDKKTVDFDSVSSASTWLIAASIAVYKNRTFNEEEEEDKRWPVVLILWWVYTAICSFVSVTNYPNFHLISYKEVVCFPFFIVLCISVIANKCQSKRGVLEEPLLRKVSEGGSEDADAFDNASFWSRLTFQWLNPLFRIGQKQKLEFLHIPSVPQSERAEYASSLLENSIRKQKPGLPLLPKAISFAIWKSLAMNGILAGISTVASYLGPFLIMNFVNFLSTKDQTSSYSYGLILALIFFSSKTVESLTQRHWYFGAQRIGVQVRAGLMVLIYKKCLSVKLAGLSNGKIINLINVDVERIGDFCWYIHGIWLLPLQVFLALLILYRNLGAAPAIAALLSTVLVMVSNTPLANMQEKLHTKIMEAKDARIKATSEMLKSMRVLKLHSWESTFLKRILLLRDSESSWLKKYLYTCSAVAFLFWASPTLVSVATFGVCIAMKTPLSAGTVLSALATFRILQEPIYNLPELISMIVQTKISMDRLDEFLREEDQKRLLNYQAPRALDDVAVEIEPGEYAWDSCDQSLKKPTITVTERIRIMKGYKVAICGSVGSGKSSLMCSMIGEIPRITGATTKVSGRTAYVPQSAWIQIGTVRENILFGRNMDASFYESVLDCCALNQDIQMWSEGDLTVVGERGVNLSGGQKQRIQLARSVYSDSDIYFLDDPFSAVDANTGTHLFKRCLMQLLSQKTVIYSTHQLGFLDAADLVLTMKDGRIVQSGKYDDLIMDPLGELVRQVDAHRQSINQVSPPQVDETSSIKPCQIEVQEEKFVDCIRNAKLLRRTQEEETETGPVKRNVYWIFVKYAYKGALVPVILLCQVLFQGLQMGSNYWIAWATEKSDRISREKLIGVFILMSGGSSIFILGRAVLLSTIAIKTAQHLFLGMVSSVFRAPVSFFDSTPSSQILSRSSTDQSTVDTDIPYRLAGLVFALIQLLSIIVLMSQVAWQVFFLFVVVLAISVWYQAYYISTARELARMVGTRKAPILHHFSESIAGAAIVRCFSQEYQFVRRIHSLVDNYSCVVFNNCSTMEWLCLRTNFLFNSVFFIVLVILVSLPRSAIDPSLAGLVATYGLNLTVLQAWVIWNLCNVENKMICVEIILQFTGIPSEAPSVVEDYRPDPEWPRDGRIELENLHVRYTPSLPMVLKGITCTFPGGKKVGVVGRTGSGKSTLIQAIFRVVEPSGGRILIDGMNICQLGLQDLRSRLSIIPQDPVLFQGTVRANLDPLQQHSDEEIWGVLNKCHLAEMVRRDPKLLDAPVAEDGENWSVGQRQLVCLARVLLKRRKILVLDEATASIDTATDNVIQQTIRRETGKCTVITVAHRIPTVIDNDLVLVLDEGQVLEYESPKRLLESKHSSFSKLVSEFLRRSSNRSEMTI